MRGHEGKLTMGLGHWKMTVTVGLVLVLFCPGIWGHLEWVRQPENRAVAVGVDLILLCEAKWSNQSTASNFVLNYKWQLNGGNLTAKVSRFYNNSLFIPNFLEADLGNYTCQVSALNQGQDGGLGSLQDNLIATAQVIQAFLQPFVIHPVSQQATVGEKVMLTCVTGQSAPSVEVQWLRNGQVFTGGQNLTASFGDFDSSGLRKQLSMKLIFTVTSDVFGMFECLAVNTVLREEVHSQQANITNKIVESSELPIIKWDLPHQLLVSQGQNVIMSCQTEESTEPVIVGWYVGRYRVDESRRVIVLPNSSLAFLPVRPGDSGNYSCVAENSKGMTSSPFVDLAVTFLGIDFRTQPSDTFAFYGEEVILECDPPDSIPPAAVTWYKDYTIVNQTSDRIRVIDNNLHINSAMKADKGIYYCVAVNNFTSPSSRTSRLARLTVEGPPIMLQPPSNTKVVKGKLLQLTCLVDSDPLPITTWLFEGSALPDSDKVTIINRGQELSITNVGKVWEGRYTCESRNKYGHIEADAFVIVSVPPVTLRPIGEIVVVKNASVTIPCPVVSDPQPSITWYHNGAQITQQNAESGVGTPHYTIRPSELVLDPVIPQHSGNYTCVGSNQEGTASASGSLVVHVKPSITTPPEDTVAVTGSYVRMTCHAQGNPPPSIVWLHNSSTTLPGGSQLSEDKTVLTLPQMSWEAVGTYVCMASNLLGVVSTSAELKIQTPPKIENMTYPTTPVKMETKFTLTCTVSGIPPPSVQWTHQGSPVQPSLDGRVRLPDRGVLRVEVAQKSDSGLYECVVNSSVGSDRKQISLVVYGTPSPPRLLSAVPLGSDSVYLLWEWTHTEDVSEIVDSFQIYYREKTEEETQVYPADVSKNTSHYEVVGLKPGLEYVFYMSAVNDIGVGRPSNVMSAVTLQSGPSEPVNLQAASITQTSATLTWEVPTSPNGVVKMYQLRFRRINEFYEEFVFINITRPDFPTQEVLLSPLRPYSQYEAQVRAVNIDSGQFLFGSFSSLFTFHTLTAKPSLPPQGVQVKAVDPFTLLITWQHIPLLAQNGPITFYHIVYTDNESTILGNPKVNNSVTQFTIRGLSPWRPYTVTIRGENTAGFGPTSDPVITRTLPVAPVAAPGDFKVVAESSTSLKISWKALPAEVVTCNITDYLVKYRLKGSSEWKNLSVPSSLSTISQDHILDSLEPWSWYESRVAAFTNTLTPGLGPFTDGLLVRTLEGESSPVTVFSYTANVSSISLSWQPPSAVRGVLIGYRVTFQPLSNNNTFDGVETLDIKSSTTAVLQYLHPNTVYNISVGAVNGAGLGKELVVRARTLPLPQTTVSATVAYIIDTTDTANDTSYAVGQSDSNSHIKKNLASIVAGSIVGGIAFIIITVFICVKCMKYRRKQRLNYAVSTDDVNIEGSFRPLESPTAPYMITPSVIAVDSPHKSSQATESPSQFVTSVTQSSSSSSRRSQSALYAESERRENVDESRRANSMSAKEEKQKGRSPSRLSIPRLSISHNYSKLDEDDAGPEGSLPQVTRGIDNPAFVAVIVEADSKAEEATDNLSSLPQDTSKLAVANDDTISVSSDTMRRRNRMRSESAAAIAVMRNSQVITTIDTDMLVDTDINTEVIFNERTVL